MGTVTLQDLAIGYRTHGQLRTVAAGLNATIGSGQLTCLLGANGIGKSTLLRTLSAAQPPLSGSVLLMGRNLSEYTDRELSHTVGIVLTERPEVVNMTAYELVGLGRQPYTGFWGTLSAADRAVVDEAIRLTGTAALSRRTVSTLSDGERQKVMVAKALAQQTPVIFLDEPTAFLDFPSKVELLLLLHRLAREQQKTVFLSTHDVELALQVADQLWLMEPQGLTVGTPDTLAAGGQLTRFLERDGITFDPATLTVRVRRP